MKIIAWYLPQFHVTPENNKWWGEGFTEWTNVKKAKQYAPDQYQPRVPLNGNYYDLTDVKTQEWQVSLAKEYGVYGFCMHHYWFDGKLLLEKPVEQYLANPQLDLPFCLCWANEHWTNAWADGTPEILIEQHYGGPEEWEQHFAYLLPFFRDPRYIKHGNKPFFIIYRAELIECLAEMMVCWQELSRAAGFDGIDFACKTRSTALMQPADIPLFTYQVDYQPGDEFEVYRMQHYGPLIRIQRFLSAKLSGLIHFDIGQISPFKLQHYDYDEIWNMILKRQPTGPGNIPGAFTDWDNTPRKDLRGKYTVGVSPEKFGNYLARQIRHARDDYHADMIFLFAWNEWAEGGYLEPDEKNGHGFLQAIRKALQETGEWEGPAPREALL